MLQMKYTDSVVVVMYVLMWSIQGILVHRAKRISNFDASTIVLFQDIVKLTVSCVLLTREFPGGISKPLTFNRKSWTLYLVPAGLYGVYNVLTFTALSMFEPSRYFVLMQARIVVTGVIHGAVMGRRLSVQQWTGLVTVMLGAMLKEYDLLTGRAAFGSISSVGYAIVGVQILLSTTAGVANERLLKTGSVSQNLQNMFMYSWSIVVDLAIMLLSSQTVSLAAVTADTIPIILNGSAVGLVTSLLLKRLSSVVKAVASAVELWVTALLSSVVFGYPLTPGSVVGTLVVTAGALIYAIPVALGASKKVN